MNIPVLSARLEARRERKRQAEILAAYQRRRFGRKHLLILVALGVLAFGAVHFAGNPPQRSTAPSAYHLTTAESNAHGMIQGARAATGRSVVYSNGPASTCARSWSQHMASRGEISHSSDGGRRCAPHASAWGEIVGVGFNLYEVFRAFLASASHRNVIYGNYRHVGIGVVQSDGSYWLTCVFFR